MKATPRDEAPLVNYTVLASTISALLAGGSAAQAQEPQPQALRIELETSGSVIEVRILPVQPDPEDETREAQQRLLTVLRNTIA